MAVGCGGVLIHYSIVRAECYLFPLAFAEIDRHSGQALSLVELVDYILPLILEREVQGYDSYQWAVPLRAEEGTQTGYLLGNTSSGVQGQPSFTELSLWAYTQPNGLACRGSLSNVY